MRTPLVLLLGLTLLACRNGDKDTEVDPEREDLDGDGFIALVDCNDADPMTYPGADETCDQLDNDCDGNIDENPVDGDTWNRDADSDGYGSPYDTVSACAQPDGYVDDDQDCNDFDPRFNPDATEDDCSDPSDYNCDGTVGFEDGDGDGFAACEDCNDADPTVSPAALEVCDGVDNDCDGTVDTSAVDAPLFFLDDDDDGHGDPATSARDCDAPVGYVELDDDCDDDDPSVHPGADETCDGTDEDCDGTVDEDATDGDTWYQDLDDDGFGSTRAEVACDAPVGFVADPGDCDDLDPARSPLATEVCDGLDNDCDGDTDEDDAADAPTWYADADLDGYGDPATAATACTQPEGTVADGTDCDDTDSDVGGPDAWYPDLDDDGYGPDDGAVDSCDPMEFYVSAGGDCDDDDATRSPGAPELCGDAIDNDCDGDTDEDDASDAPVWYLDADGDGQGGTTSMTACTQPAGTSDLTGDCDDTRADVATTAPEVCDGLDNDCDGDVDGGATDATTFYADDDADGYGDPAAPTDACAQPVGTVRNDGDCDDTTAAARPGNAEVCDGLDNDCDGTTDDGALDAVTWYLDSDGDTFGTPSSTTEACTQPTGYVADDSDCDDTTAAVAPGVAESCNDTDDDCDGDVDEFPTDANTWYLDADGDGQGGAATLDACDPPTGYVGTSIDCDDLDPTAYVGGTEVCDGADNDCDGTADNGATDAASWYIDGDGDGQGDGAATLACDAPGAAWVLSDTDCDDSDPSTFLGAFDVCDGVDNDCSGTPDDGVDAPQDWYLDADGDGFGFGAGEAILACGAPSPAWVLNPTDCDDSDPSTHPAAVEVCGGGDEDCDGSVDEDSAVDAVVWYADSDGDGYGDAADLRRSCVAPAGFVRDATDCDDTDGRTYPGAPELCDGIDRDCNGQPDLGTPDCPADSCDDLYVAGFATSGAYTISPNDTGAYRVYCDQDLAGGGWTLLAVFTNDDAEHWTDSDNWLNWVTTTTFGDAWDPTVNADAKSQAFNNLPIDEVMIVHAPSSEVVRTDIGCVGADPILTLFQRNSQNNDDCAVACPTITAASPWTGQSYQDSSYLRFRCTDNDGVRNDAAGYRYEQDNSFITTLDNRYEDNNFGLGAGESNSIVDYDTSTSDVGTATTGVRILLYGR